MPRRHSVLTPDPSSAHKFAVHDVALLLADLVRSRRMEDRAWLLEPFAPPAVCQSCEKAYRIAHTILAAAGGVEAWIAGFQEISARVSAPLAEVSGDDPTQRAGFWNVGRGYCQPNTIR